MRSLARGWLAPLALACLLTGAPAAGADEELRRVPNLIGRTPSEAGHMLRTRGLRGPVADVLAVSDDVAVVWQHPTAGAYVPALSTVQVRWREQPAASRRVQRQVPDLEGMTQEQAEEALRAVDLGVEVRLNRTGRTPFRIQGQSPHAGVLVWPGSVVTAYVYVPEGSPDVGPTLTTVPDLTGRRRAEVVDLLARARLGGPADLSTAAGDPAGHVADGQTPHPRERVPVGSVVRVRWRLLSAEPVTVTVPNLKGLTLLEARQRLLDLSLLAEPRFVPVPGRPDGGKVYDQSPAAGALVRSGGTVAVTINAVGVMASAAIVDVPNLTNMLPEEAEAALKAAGMGMEIHPRRDSITHLARALLPAPPRVGRVWSWNPKRAAMGSTVTIWLVGDVEGEPWVNGKFPMPDLRWMPQARAEQALRDAGLRLSRAHDASASAPRGVPVGAVFDQRPNPGERVEAGDWVHLYVNQRGSGSLAVPDVRGMTLARARSTLRASQLAVTVAGAPRGASDTALVVSEQRPAAGAGAVSGATVSLTVAMAQVVVPGLLGLSKEQAIERLRAVHLSADLVGPTSRLAMRSQVTGQTPRAGAHVARGTIVRVTYELLPFEFRPMPRR